ncbi:MAG: lysylphosphatidylglycerol synthase transmembrane domain-containing protein [Myxococcota bacterium]
MGEARWKQLQLWGGILLGVGLLGWFVSSIDFAELGAVLSDIHWGWLVVSVIAVLAHYALHGWRWKVLLAHVDPDLDWKTVWRGTTILWGFNTILPLRAGNLLRPAVVALTRNIPYTTLLFTLVAETVCDAFGVVGLVLAMLVMLPGEVNDAGPLVQLKSWGIWLSAAALVGLGLVTLLSTRRARTVAESMLVAVPSDRVRQQLLKIFDQLVEGMAAVGDPAQMFGALVVTALVWGSWLLGIEATLRAFGLKIPAAGAMFIEAALTIVMMFPQAPGFLGVFQVVTEEALTLFDAPPAEAKAVALVFWTVCFVPITLLGVWDGWRMGIGLAPGSRAHAFTDLERRAATDEVERSDPGEAPAEDPQP